MSELIPEDILSEAYNQQKKLVDQLLNAKTISGYKIAVAAKAGQRNLGLKQPISGVLFKEGEIHHNDTVSLSDFNLVKIETEVGYRLGAAISETTTANSIKQFVEAILPVFEVPNVVTDKPVNTPVEETIAKNAFSSHYVLGNPVEPKSVDPNEIVAKLYHNNTLINTGNASDAMDDQWEALSVALNLSIEQGYKPKKGDIIITGALGKILDMQTGVYKADYGKLGVLEVNVID